MSEIVSRLFKRPHEFLGITDQLRFTRGFKSANQLFDTSLESRFIQKVESRRDWLALAFGERHLFQSGAKHGFQLPEKIVGHPFRFVKHAMKTLSGLGQRQEVRLDENIRIERS